MYELDANINDAWLSPEGKFYDGKAHEVTALDIIYELTGIEVELFQASDMLIAMGWKKVTTSEMYDFYKDDGHYNFFASEEQKDSFNQWRIIHHLN